MSNREILFRGYDLEAKRWRYGDLIQRKCDGFERLYIYDNTIDETEIDEYTDTGYCMAPTILRDLFYKIDPATIGQYVGLRDKNGKRIFEGDILEYCCEKYTVTVDKKHGYRFMYGLDQLTKFNGYSSEITGNIHTDREGGQDE